MLWEPFIPPGIMTIGAVNTVSKCTDGVGNRPVSGRRGTYVPVRQDRSFTSAVSMSEDPMSR